ncbi:MAG: hypothetical protein ACK53L_35430, partial [Pirellulaceae bacterium]
KPLPPAAGTPARRGTDSWLTPSSPTPLAPPHLDGQAVLSDSPEEDSQGKGAEWTVSFPPWNPGNDTAKCIEYRDGFAGSAERLLTLLPTRLYHSGSGNCRAASILGWL